MDIKIIAGVILGAIIFFSILYAIKKSKNPLKRATTTVATGLVSLVAVNIAGIFTGVYIPISTLSICSSAVGGIPAVTAMLIIDTFFK
ncbi:MAG: pro-sigmaK processing inhibitor BofA family protein [Acutalibacteraceae bacterium]|nr:pro-sigmaK processing inhibitor BofA family protein [Acutalibacteraceae bacterium]